VKKWRTLPRRTGCQKHLLLAVDRANSPPLTPPLGPDAVDAFGWYALAVTDVESLALSDVFCRILQREDFTIMSTLERTFQKGIAQGLEQGIERGKAEGKADILLRQLAQRFRQLDRVTVNRIRSGSPEQLDRWLDRVLDAQTLDAVLTD